MNGYEAVVKKIIDDANFTAERIIIEAEQNASKLIETAKADTDVKGKKATEDFTALKESIMNKKIALADSECKKIMSGAKKNLIDEAFALAKEEIVKLKNDKYKELVAAMIFSAAQDGDVVVISERDKDIITSKFVAEIAKKLKISLTLSDKYGAFVGGVVLSSKNLDKNLSLDLELSTLREEIEPEIALILDAPAKK